MNLNLTAEEKKVFTAFGKQNTGYHSDSKAMEMKQMTDGFYYVNLVSPVEIIQGNTWTALALMLCC